MRGVPYRDRREFTTGEVAEFIGVYIEKVIRWVHSGKLRASRPRGGWSFRIPLAEVQRLLRERGIVVSGVWPRDEIMLLIDDDPRVLRIVTHFFRIHRVPIEVEIFTAVEPALARLDRLPRPALVVMDWNLDKKTAGALRGLNAVRRIAASPATRTVPIILMSATDPDAAQRAVRDHGLVDFIKKPLVLDTFKKKIWNHVFGSKFLETQGPLLPMTVEIPG